MARAQKIVWIDVESTGIDPYFEGEKLLQVACRITDENLEFIDGDGFEGKVFYLPATVETMKASSVPFVTDMHTTTGLWDELPKGTPLWKLEQQLLDHIKQYVPEPNTARIGGNSITLDRTFLHAYMPKVLNHLSYRSYDVTTLAGLVEIKMGSGKMYRKSKAATHEAMFDITESVNELRYYMDLLFPAE